MSTDIKNIMSKVFPKFHTFHTTLIFHFSVNVVDGEVLHITKVSRLHMGAYLCIASNGVPPSISKRVMLRVQCEWVSLYSYIICTRKHGLPKTTNNSYQQTLVLTSTYSKHYLSSLLRFM